MTTSRWLSPAAYAGYVRQKWIRFRADARLASLEQQGENGRRLADVIRRARARDYGQSADWVSRIESERERLSNDDTPLVAGTDGTPGPFDAGQTVAQACGVSKKKPQAAVLHLLVREFGPTLGLELGTNVGLSSSYIASAMSLAGAGRLITCEASPVRTSIAGDVHNRLGLDQVRYVVGLFADTLDGVLEDCNGLDLAFIDGQHQKQPTLDFFDAIYPRLADPAIVVFDDIRWSQGMKEAWHILRHDPRIPLSVDLDLMGVCLVGSSVPERFASLPIPV